MGRLNGRDDTIYKIFSEGLPSSDGQDNYSMIKRSFAISAPPTGMGGNGTARSYASQICVYANEIHYILFAPIKTVLSILNTRHIKLQLELRHFISVQSL